MKSSAQFKFCLTRLVMLLLCLWILAPQASADVTIWVQANSAPRLYVFDTSGTCTGTVSGTTYSSYMSWSGNNGGALMTKSVTTSDNKVWYYEVFEGLNSASIILNNGSGSQTSDITEVSGTKYFYYSGSNKHIDLTSCKDKAAYCFLETSTSYWEKDGATFEVWDGNADVWMTKVGGVKNGNSIYLYTKNSSVTDGATIYFKRMSSDGNSKWNEGSAPYHLGGYYTNTGWSNVSYQSGSSFGTIVWPEMPVVTTYTFSVNVYDATGAPSVNGTTLSNTTSGTNCQWYTYTYTDTSLPSSVTVASSTGATATLSDPADGQTYYYAWNGYTVQAVSSDYDPNRRNLIYWSNGSSYSNGTQATPTTSDGINYSVSGLAFAGDDWMVFTTTFSGNWDNDKNSFYGASNNVTISGNSATGAGVKGQTGIIHVTNAGIWSFTYNIITNEWTATRTGDLPQNTYTIHVIEYYEKQPYLYAWSGSGSSSVPLNGNFPGSQMTETENSAAGETWYVKSLSSPAETISVIANLGSSASQTADITGIAPGDYYIVFDGSTKQIRYQGTTMPEGKQQAPKNTFTVYVMADAAPYIYLWDDNNVTIGDGWPGVQMSDTEELADGNSWWKFEVETYDDDINLLFHNNGGGNDNQSGDINQTEPVGYYIYDGYQNAVQTVDPTGELYAIGQVNGNPWTANKGLKMTAQSDGTFTLNNVQIIAGATFAFATQLATEENGWAALGTHRLNPPTTPYVVTNAMTNKDNPSALALEKWNGTDKEFKMDETAYYDITVDTKAMTVTIKRRYGALYMFYGDSESPYWKPNAGVPMFTTDGNTFMLTNVELKAGDTFQFATQLGANESTWPANEYRVGSAATNNSIWEVTTSQLDIVLENAVQVGSTKDFKMDPGTDGTYRVVVNPSAGTLALYHMAEVLGSKVIIHLEQTSNVKSPVLWAYDKERDPTNHYYIHVDRPDRDTIALARLPLQFEAKPDITTADGRKWWTWEVPNAIVDFWFTRDPYTYVPTDLVNKDMTDIQWRRSGEIFLTWSTAGTAMEDYTRDYYAAAAQEAPECAVMIEGHNYAYFTNTPGWAHVFCHAWYTDNQGVNHDLLTPPAPYEGGPTYPGALCELVGYDKDGYEVWRIDLTEKGVTTYPNGGILFNNGIDNNHDYEHELNHDYYTGEGTIAAKEQSSDFVYSNGACYDYCGVIVLGRSLSNIITKGVVNGPVYTIEEELVGVWVDRNAVTEIEVENNDGTTSKRYVYGALYCKDQNNFVTTPYVEKSLAKEGEIDYVLTLTSLMQGKNRYDQSNWVKLTLSTQYPGINGMSAEDQVELLSGFVGSVLPAESVHGQLVNNVNPEMRLAQYALPLQIDKEDFYCNNPNVFVTANFIGTQNSAPITDETGQTTSHTYFFVTPKPQEYAKITWAVYAGNNKFYVPASGAYAYVAGQYEFMNQGDLNGYFPVSWDLMKSVPNMESGEAYSFHAIIRLADDETPAIPGEGPTRTNGDVPYKPYDGTVPYIVCPTDISTESIITAVNDVNTTKAVKQVRYYNLAGVESSKPFDGVNVVVTTFTDGTRTVAKVMK